MSEVTVILSYWERLALLRAAERWHERVFDGDASLDFPESDGWLEQAIRKLEDAA